MTVRYTVAVPLFEHLTALDAIGPYEMLQRVPGLDVVFVGERAGEVRTDNEMLGLVADRILDEVVTPDVVVVPGGPGTREVLDGPLVEWLRAVHPTTRYTTSVCSGSLVLGAAGLLRGLRATSHFGVRSLLARYGAVPTARRVVEELDARVITAAGVSSGIDMALRLIELLVDRTAAEAAQLWTEYDPRPPFTAGHPDTASHPVMERALSYARSRS